MLRGISLEYYYGVSHSSSCFARANNVELLLELCSPFLCQVGMPGFERQYGHMCVCLSVHVGSCCLEEKQRETRDLFQL